MFACFAPNCTAMVRQHEAFCALHQLAMPAEWFGLGGSKSPAKCGTCKRAIKTGELISRTPTNHKSRNNQTSIRYHHLFCEPPAAKAPSRRQVRESVKPLFEAEL